jgi:hypothetical protein
VTRFTVELERIVDRLHTLSEARLARAFPPHPSVADAARELAQLLADTAASLEPEPPDPAPAGQWGDLGADGVGRRVPRLPDLAVGDQVAVTGHDVLLAAARPLEAAELGRLAAAADACRALRLGI